MPADPHKTAFIAGAAGAIGRVLGSLLLEDGWRVVGTTRSPRKADELRARGVEPVVVDVFDRDALIRLIVAATPHVVIHQLTDLPKEFSAEAMAAARPGNARIREVGTSNLIAAAVAAGASRLIAQSIAFAYGPGPRPIAEDAPIDRGSFPAVATLEELVLAAPMEAIVLRYGRLYGPHTWNTVASGEAPVHVDAAADAARLATTRGKPGAYNIAEDDGVVSSDKARRELGWSPDYRR